jgi:NADPH2:quinone reductase
MHAIVISAYGGPEVLTLTELPEPVPGAGDVLIKVHAFGLNHAESYMRSGAWGEVAQVTGIECAGTVEYDPSGTLAAGTTVIAILGGMGRTRNGSYAELVTVPATNVVPVNTILPWTDLVAIPETYATAWTTLHDNLAIAAGQSILVRGASSALGRAVVDLAVDAGANVVATTRNPDRSRQLADLGAARVLVDDGAIAAAPPADWTPVDAVVDIVGNTTLRDSLRLVRPRGRVCQIGFLGGLAPVADFDPLSDLPTGVQLSFFGSAFVLGSSDYPLSAVPFADIVAKAEAGTLHTKPVRVFDFDDIVTAHKTMEAGTAGGKMVVSVAD